MLRQLVFIKRAARRRPGRGNKRVFDASRPKEPGRIAHPLDEFRSRHSLDCSGARGATRPALSSFAFILLRVFGPEWRTQNIRAINKMRRVGFDNSGNPPFTPAPNPDLPAP